MALLDVPDATTIRLLGHFEVRTRGSPLELSLQAQRVMAFLAISGVPVHRQELAGRLWPASNEKRARGNLRTALWQIRSAVDEAVIASRGAVALAADVAIDYRALLDDLEVAHPAAAPAEIVAHLRNDLLPGWDEEWLVVERERARQLRMRRLEDLSRRCVISGDIQVALSAAYAAIEIEPLRESAHLTLIEAHTADGNRAEAVRQVRWMVSLLRAELNVDPSPVFWQEIAALGLPTDPR